MVLSLTVCTGFGMHVQCPQYTTNMVYKYQIHKYPHDLVSTDQIHTIRVAWYLPTVFRASESPGIYIPYSEHASDLVYRYQIHSIQVTEYLDTIYRTAEWLGI